MSKNPMLDKDFKEIMIDRDPPTQAHVLKKIKKVDPMAQKIYAKIVEKIKSGDVLTIPRSYRLPDTMRTVNLTFEELGSPKVIHHDSLHRVVIMAQNEFGIVDWRGGGGLLHIQFDFDYLKWQK